MGERGEQKFQTGLRKSRALFPFLGRVCVRREIHQGRKSHTDHLGKQICPADFLYSSMVKGGGMCPKHREREREKDVVQSSCPREAAESMGACMGS